MDEYLKMLKSLSESTRLRILVLLQQAREVCVSDIVEALQENQYKVSRHLKVLQDAGLVENCRKGRWVYYKLNQKNFDFKDTLLHAVDHITSDILNEDLNRLKKRLKVRGKHECDVNNRILSQ